MKKPFKKAMYQSAHKVEIELLQEGQKAYEILKKEFEVIKEFTDKSKTLYKNIEEKNNIPDKNDLIESVNIFANFVKESNNGILTPENLLFPFQKVTMLVQESPEPIFNNDQKQKLEKISQYRLFNVVNSAAKILEKNLYFLEDKQFQDGISDLCLEPFNENSVVKICAFVEEYSNERCFTGEHLEI